jgi:predicted  nucleic acid-binding Zn-ribbon protein
VHNYNFLSEVFHVTHPDIVKQLQHDHPDAVAYIRDLQNEIEALREEIEIWKDRYHAEKQDHEATMKAWDEERSGL